MKKSNSLYTSSDLSGNFLADVSYNIKSIDAKDAEYNLIICYHVLEHIDEDILAMQELYRVLKSGGSCLIQTPFKDGDIYEDDTITTPEDREKYFGQDDHVRIYSVAGLKKRLEQVGFLVTTRNFSDESENKHGFIQNETMLICDKP